MSIVFDTLFSALKEKQNKDNAKQMSAYMKNQFDFLGIQSPVRKQISQPFLKEAKNNSLDKIFVQQCWQCPFRELQYVALDYLRKIQKQLTINDIPFLKDLILTKSWWDTIDYLDRIVGGIALQYPELNPTLLEWSTAPNKWLRRVSIDHQLLRKEKTNTELLEQIICNNLGQTEFFINKAIGWALRDYSKTNPDWVRNFLEKYELQMAKLSLKEASKYL